MKDFCRLISGDKQKKRFFKTFYQVDYGTDTKFGFKGLDLAISQGVIRVYGVKIPVKRE